jgi:SAM-dependent methyltransferase
MSPFDSAEAEAINKARMEHLESLGLDLAGKTVLDVGCGVGKLAPFFLEKGCRVWSMDARTDNVEQLRIRMNEAEHIGRWHSLNWNVETQRMGPEWPFSSRDHERIDIVFCYGLLYHLTDPARALQNMASTGAELLLLETMVCDCSFPVLVFDREEKESFDQGLSGWGTRASTPLIVSLVSAAGWPNIYLPKTVPAHPDFQWAANGVRHFPWDDGSVLMETKNLRRIFVASRSPLANPKLIKA